MYDFEHNLEQQLNHHSTTYAYYQAILDTKLFPAEKEFFESQQALHATCFCALLGDNILRELFDIKDQPNNTKSD